MSLRINSIRLKPDHTEKELKNSILKRLRINENDLISYKLVKHSIDARDKADIRYVICVDAEVRNEDKVLKDRRIKDVILSEPVVYKDPGMIKDHIGKNDLKENILNELSEKAGNGHQLFTRPVITGFGPAGMICAYKLAEAGLRPIVIERGLNVERRMQKVNDFWNSGELDENTNVQFGEGGAGTFSDGKLSTMIHDKVGRIGEFFRILVENGADESILYDAKPHVGTDRLAVIVKNIRNRIIGLGGEIRFGCKLKDIIFDDEWHVREVIVEDLYEKADNGLNHEYIIGTDSLVIAVGHSARDTFEMLHSKGFLMEQKPFAVGVRVQHPQELIGYAQYGDQYTKLPPADYKLTYQSERLNRGVYSFCMCPGGFVVNSSSEKGRLVVNGMSNSDRGEATANSAVVVNVDRRDFENDEWNAGIEFQRKLEERAFAECRGKIPVQKYGEFRDTLKLIDNPDMILNGDNDITGKSPDFVKKIKTDAGLDLSMSPNTKGSWDSGNIHNILPGQICEAILEAFPDFGRKIKGFDTPEALLMGVESRTSSPVRISRGDTLEAAGFPGIYPCGEGAGYAGGITSAAVDGIRVYEALIGKFYDQTNYKD